MNTNAAQANCRRLWEALVRCPPLSTGSTERDRLWLVVQECICTRGAAAVTPLGSRSQIVVTAEYASDELIAAMTWLQTHDHDARRLRPLELFVMLRGVATKGANGSGRAAQADALHGMTNVEQGQPVRWTNLDESGAA